MKKSELMNEIEVLKGRLFAMGDNVVKDHNRIAALEKDMATLKSVVTGPRKNHEGAVIGPFVQVTGQQPKDTRITILVPDDKRAMFWRQAFEYLLYDYATSMNELPTNMYNSYVRRTLANKHFPDAKELP